MNKILVSCFSLCKIENNGKFKSTKQADFILSQFDENNQYHAMTIASYNNLVNWEVTADQAGIVSIIKTAEKSGKKAVYFQRRNDADQADLIAQKELESKQMIIESNANLDQQIAIHEKIIAERKLQDDVLIATVQTMVDQGKATEQQLVELKQSLHLCFLSAIKANLAEIERYKSHYQTI